MQFLFINLNKSCLINVTHDNIFENEYDFTKTNDSMTDFSEYAIFDALHS